MNFPAFIDVVKNTGLTAVEAFKGLPASTKKKVYIAGSVVLGLIVFQSITQPRVVPILINSTPIDGTGGLGYDGLNQNEYETIDFQSDGFGTSSNKSQMITDFCQIHNGNLNQYASIYDSVSNIEGTYSPPTPYRAFRVYYYPYNISKELIAQPLYYTGFSDGIVRTAFQLKGKLGNTTIGNKDIVVQLINYYPMNASFKIAGYCVNRVFYPADKEKIRSIDELPAHTFSVLLEASLGLNQEQTDNLAK